MGHGNGVLVLQPKWELFLNFSKILRKKKLCVLIILLLWKR